MSADARAALARMLQMKFDVVICDWIMADMDGFALISRMRADPALKSTPFIVNVFRGPGADRRRPEGRRHRLSGEAVQAQGS